MPAVSPVEPDDELLDFTRLILERHGALIERGEDALEALLPKELAQRLGLGEHVLLSASPASAEPRRGESPRGIPITYGSPVLEAIVGLAEGLGQASAVSLGRLYLKRADPASEVERTFHPLNSRAKGLEAKETMGAYWIFHFRYAALSDERQEGIVSMTVNGETLAEVRGLEERWPEGDLEEEGAPGERGDSQPLAEVYRRACLLAQTRINEHLKEFYQSRERRLHRDTLRLEEYYRDLAREIRSRIEKKKLEGKERAGEEAKARAAEIELQVKVRELEEKYAVSVRASLVSVLHVRLPVLRVRALYQRRREVRELALFWNPLLKAWEPLGCEACGEGTFAFSLCDERLHVACALCSRPCPACGHRFCPACHLKGCPSCQRGQG